MDETEGKQFSSVFYGGMKMQHLIDDISFLKKFNHQGIKQDIKQDNRMNGIQICY
ncbi:MAG: hypothetical protein RLZZ511_2829 [Cyanobacteriota bacterium]|jgi:hypothetical protein